MEANFYLTSIVRDNYLISQIPQRQRISFLFCCAFLYAGTATHSSKENFLVGSNNNKIISKYHSLSKYNF